MRFRGKRPTRSQKIIISRFGFCVSDWLVARENEKELIIVHRHIPTKVKTLPKGMLI